MCIVETRHDHKRKRKTKGSCYFPARYALSFLTFWGMSLEFAHRVCLSVTIVVMVNHNTSRNGTEEDTAPSCPVPPGYNDTDPYDTGKFNWSPAVQGTILGAYFYGFVCTQLIGGRLAEMFGGKWLLGLSIMCASLLTLATPAAANMGVAAIVVLRIVMGLAHGVCLPSVFAMFSQWAPDEERSTMIALCLIGDHVGTVLSMPLAGYLCDNGFAGGWPSVFYVLGALGCLWFLFWCCFAYSLPSEHPRISQEELEYIVKGQKLKSQLPVPWVKMLTSMPVWAIAIVTFCAAWGQTTLLTKLPAYLESVLNVPIKKNGLLNSLVYVSSCVTLLFSGYVSDVLRLRKKSSPTKIRKTFQFFAMVGPSICTALIPHVACDRTAAIALLTGAMALLGLCGGGHVSVAAELSPHHAGTVFGLVNSMGCTAGVFSPLVAGIMLEAGHDRLESWSLVFYTSSALYIFGAIAFMAWGSAEIQPWASSTADSSDSEKKLTEESQIINFSKTLEDSMKYGAIC